MRKYLISAICVSAGCLACFGRVILSGRRVGVRPEPAGDHRFALNPGGIFPKIPGDPETAVRSFRHLYRAMIGFRTNRGRLPAGFELKDLSRPIAPGIQLTIDDISCSDAKTPEFAASRPETPGPDYEFNYRGVRPNGRHKPAFPQKGEKDLWFSSKHYKRTMAIGKGNNARMVNYGVIVGLFSDGDIQIRSMDQLVAVRHWSNGMQIRFPDETGLPKGLLSVNDTWQNLVDEARLNSRNQYQR